MIQILHEDHPRLYHPVDDPDYRFDPPEDAARKRILKNILADCEIFYFQQLRVWYRTRMDSRLVLRKSGTGST